MSNRELVQDLLAHATEAPAHCAALMRRAARELQRAEHSAPVPACADRRIERAPCA
jgi:hypothetical protein